MMAASMKLNNPLSSFSFQTQLPTQKSPPSQQIHLTSLKTPCSSLCLKTQLIINPILLPKTISIKEEEEEEIESVTAAYPSLRFANTLFFNSAYNIQVIVGDNEDEEKLINRFRREVLRAGVLQECKRRRFFECNQDKRKRKTREAAKRNKKRRPRPKVSSSTQAKAEASKKKEDSDDDNWEFLDIDLPYS